MKFHLVILSAFILALVSYQPVQAGANSFTSLSVKPGDNLMSILRQQGFSAKERQKVLAADNDLKRLYLTLDTRYLVKKSNAATEIQIFDSQADNSFRIYKSGDKVTAGPFSPRFQVKNRRVSGKVIGSLSGSIMAQVKSNWVVSRFRDAYAFDMKSARSLQKGAPFWFVVEKKYIGNHFIKYGEVLQTSLEIQGKVVHKKFVRHKGGGVFFAADDLLDDKPFYAPVDYVKIASTFQPNRLHPITRKRQPHLGIDFELPKGETVFAPRAGTVLRFGKNRAAGNYVVLRHNNGLETYYNHLKKIDSRIRKGLQIKAGERIGLVGCTGYCTRAHLHFAVKKNGRMVNPMPFLKPYPVHFERMLESKVATL